MATWPTLMNRAVIWLSLTRGCIDFPLSGRDYLTQFLDVGVLSIRAADIRTAKCNYNAHLLVVEVFIKHTVIILVFFVFKVVAQLMKLFTAVRALCLVVPIKRNRDLAARRTKFSVFYLSAHAAFLQVGCEKHQLKELYR